MMTVTPPGVSSCKQNSYIFTGKNMGLEIRRFSSQFCDLEKKITGGQSWKESLLSYCQPPGLMRKEMEAQRGQGTGLKAGRRE